MSCSDPVASPTSVIFTATSGNTPRPRIVPARLCPSRTDWPTVSSSRAMKRLLTDRADTSSACTSGMPPPSSVASVRAICEVANLRAMAPDPRQRRASRDRRARAARAGCNHVDAAQTSADAADQQAPASSVRAKFETDRIASVSVGSSEPKLA